MTEPSSVPPVRDAPGPLSEPDNRPPSRSPVRRSRRRLGLLVLLLVALVALLVMRPDLRRPAVAEARTAGRVLAYEVLGLSPRTVYGWRLRVAGLADSPPAIRWREAVADARPRPLARRQRITCRIKPDTIAACVYTTRLAAGEALVWRLARSTADAGTLYATLEYRARDTITDSETSNRWRTVAMITLDDTSHRYTVDDDGDYRLVLQPELFGSAHVSGTIARGGSLPMPVVGAHLYDIGGGFGVPRDGGRRRHHGIDIFAARDTPVQAVVDGRVSTGNGGLGGHYIFLSTGLAGRRYYYAHLDHFAVANGARVHRGDVIGYVGNSGNAAGGPTHLHFGIYTAGGPIDPAPFVHPPPALGP